MYPRSGLALFLAAALALPLPGMGQDVSGPSNKLVSPAGGLKVVVLQGENAVNSIKRKTATQPVVEVRDESDKPVVGAEVIFHLPAAGPGGVFHGWMRTQTAKTNAQGQAGAQGMVPNDEAGRFNIKVTAASGSKTGSVIIAQTNSTRAGSDEGVSGRSKKWTIIGVLGAAALAGGIVAAKRGGDSTAATLTPVTVSPGAVTVAAPR